jgi:phosphopantothenoylcysteine synthetase/decarboxylase
MNTNMYENPIVQANIEKLRGLGYQFIEPKNSHLACGTTGKGRMMDSDKIFELLKEGL